MKFAALSLVLVACCSTAVKPRAEPPATRSAPVAEAIAAESAEPAEPAPALEALDAGQAAGAACLPRKSEPWFGADGVIVMCNFFVEPEVCHQVAPDGTVTAVPQPAAPLHAKVMGRFVEICPGDGSECDMFEPEKKTDEVPYMADVDRSGTLATVVRQVRAAKSAVVEVWDVTKEKRLAQTTLKSSGAETNHFYAWFLGRTILIGVTSDEVTEYSLWKRNGARLKRFKTLARSPYLWVVLDDRTVVMRWEDGGVDILDSSKGSIAHAVAWDGLLPGSMQVEGVFLAQMGERTFAIAPYDADRSLVGVGVGDAEGKVTPYPVAICP